jgi:GH15 family glucan-1,4-alpha-glucosidase
LSALQIQGHFMSDIPIADYALLSDCKSAALVSRDGSIDWLCFPRFDSPSVFARLLDADAGHWSLRPVGFAETSRRYLSGTMVLETEHRASRGAVVIRECLATGIGERGHELGLDSPGLVLRSVECTDGSLELEMQFRPRFEYGLVYPLLADHQGGVVARGGADYLRLSAPLPVEIDDAGARWRFAVSAGERLGFALQHRSSWRPALAFLSQDEIQKTLGDTITAWRSWAALHQSYRGPWRDLVLHSGRVLQALTYQPTGAIVAAPTTSLPEVVGGERNWDYRYSWVRDASLTMEALWVAACPDEANRFFNWMAAAAAGRVTQSDLQIMFGVGGEHDLSERPLPHLSGWRASRPVRAGNSAWNQRQLDVYGEVLTAGRRLLDQLRELDSATKTFLIDLADAAARRWQEPDQGIWEVRGGPRHFVYSKLMCWAALDAAIDIAPALGEVNKVASWQVSREEIKRAILDRGWSEKVRAFTQSFDSADLDASALMIPIVGLLPSDDPRVLATIDAIAERLTDERGLVYRYRTHDGLAGEEGTFLICTFWLAQAQAMAGRLDDAIATFERAIGCANDVGLLSEEVDSDSGELLGNFPQAFSHIGLVNAAWALAEAARIRGVSIDVAATEVRGNEENRGGH